MKWLCFICAAVLSTTVALVAVVPTARAEDQGRDAEVVKKVIKQCAATGAKYSCLAEKVAIAMERAIDWDIPLFEGLALVRNDVKFDNATASTSRGFTGLQRLTNALSRFLDAHTLSLDFARRGDDGPADEARKNKNRREGEGAETSLDAAGSGFGVGGSALGGGSGFGGGEIAAAYDSGKKDKKKHKKDKGDKKYMNYAMMVMMGIFGITGPLIMKTLAIIAGKALIASKIALIIVGSVALKKIFEKDPSERPTVKVHTIHEHLEDDHDRVFNYNPATQNFLKTMY